MHSVLSVCEAASVCLERLIRERMGTRERERREKDKEMAQE